MNKSQGEMELYEFYPVLLWDDGRIEHAARICHNCGDGMMDGYCFASGDQYACSDECLTSLPAYGDNKGRYGNWTMEMWEDNYDDDGDSYWTDWVECDEEECHICEAIIGERDEITN